jgi:hypothetical protein
VVGRHVEHRVVFVVKKPVHSRGLDVPGRHVIVRSIEMLDGVHVPEAAEPRARPRDAPRAIDARSTHQLLPNPIAILIVNCRHTLQIRGEIALYTSEEGACVSFTVGPACIVPLAGQLPVHDTSIENVVFSTFAGRRSWISAVVFRPISGTAGL